MALNEAAITQQLAQMDRDRMKAYREMLDFYHGSHWEGRPALRGEKRLTFNYAKTLGEAAYLQLRQDPH
jgi:hypothetical protein